MHTKTPKTRLIQIRHSKCIKITKNTKNHGENPTVFPATRTLEKNLYNFKNYKFTCRTFHNFTIHTQKHTAGAPPHAHHITKHLHYMFHSSGI